MQYQVEMLCGKACVSMATEAPLIQVGDQSDAVYCRVLRGLQQQPCTAFYLTAGHAGGRVYRFNEHTDRLLNSARAMGFQSIPSKEYIRNAVIKTLQGYEI